jgi:Spy/CpxP family protein refolding chaperone
MRVLLAALLLAAASAPAQAQHTHGAQPYAGLQQRPIKALSESQVADLLAGRGMSLALPAELNGYPGPSHVLEMAAALELSEAQRKAHQEMFEQMQREAQALGRQVIAAEEDLERLFAQRTASAESVAAATAEAALLQGRLRAAHLRYHLQTVAVLTPQQVRRYQKLRGY